MPNSPGSLLIINYVLAGGNCSIARVKNFIISKRKQVAPNAYQLVDNVPVEAVVTPPTVMYINFRHSETET